jgi:hypothetical protein
VSAISKRVLRILPTSGLKYTYVKTVMSYSGHVLAAVQPFDSPHVHRSVASTHKSGGPQRPVFAAYSRCFCRRQSGRSLQLATHVNLRVVTTSMMSGSTPPLLQYVFMAWCVIVNTDGTQQNVTQFFCTAPHKQGRTQEGGPAGLQPPPNPNFKKHRFCRYYIKSLT